METLDNTGIKLFVLAALKEHFFIFFFYYFVCLCCAVQVSMHYKLCLVTVCVKYCKMGDFSDCWCAFSWSICNQNGHLLGISKAAVSKVMTSYTNHGRTSSPKRNSGHK
jgi:hypothetical protein